MHSGMRCRTCWPTKSSIAAAPSLLVQGFAVNTTFAATSGKRRVVLGLNQLGLGGEQLLLGGAGGGDS